MVAVLALALPVLAGCGGSSPQRQRRPAAGGAHGPHGTEAAGAGSAAGSAGAGSAAAAAGTPTSLVYRSLYALPNPVQDPAAATLADGRFVLMGGLTAADTSTDQILVGDRSSAAVRASLPNAQHDAQAATLGGRVYLFGGGQFQQYSHILAFDPAIVGVSQAGSLPTAASDVAVAGDGSSAYVVGGFDGTNALNTVVAWQPGGQPRVIARLPVAVRYAAAAVVGRALIVAGGSTPNGDASDSIYRVDLGSGQVSVLGHLPQPLTHAGAAALNGSVFVVGGRGASTTSQVATVWSVNPSSGRVRQAGSLPAPLSDAGVLTLGGAVLVAGGRSTAGTQAGVGELVAGP